MTAIVSAENKVTGEVLRCYVIVGAVAELQIETTTRELFLEDTPEDFFVLGFDDKGNVFDSLNGIVFEWALLSDTDADEGGIVDAHNVLRIVPFGESHYQTPAHIEGLEARGLQGDRILVDGIRTGTAWVSASFKDPAYKHVKTSSVRLVVRANLLISPPDAYVLRFSDVKYKVDMVKKNTIVGITMPSSQYYLDVQDGKICSLNVETSTATGLEIGSTEIVLVDRNIKVQETFSQPSALIHVVNPSYMAFVVLPTRKWVLETGREYDILMEVYDKDSHKLHPSENVIIKSSFQDMYLDVMFSTNNGTFHHVKALKRGLTRVDGALTTIMKQDGTEHPVTPVLRHSQEVEIYDPITVLPPVLYFSWSPVHISYQYQLKASGGSGEYVWSSSHSSISMVTVRGEISTGSVGSTIIMAADMKNHAHTGSMKVHVLPPQSMTFLPSAVEAEIKTVLKLPLAVYSLHDGEHIAMTDCHLLGFNITFSDSAVFSDSKVGPPTMEGSCASLWVTGQQQGSTEVTVEHGSTTNKLHATVTIAAYKPLQPVDPEEVAVVAVGSSKEVLFEGGPLPWVLDPSQYFQDLSAEKEDLVALEQVNTYGIQRSFHIFHVLCRDLGEQKLTLNVGNLKTLKNEYPATAKSSIQFACVSPVSLQLSPQLRPYSIALPPCPISQDPSQPIPVHYHKGADLLVSVYDSKGRKFDNFSSLAVDWKISDISLLALDTPPDVFVETTTLESGAKKVKAFQKLNVFGKPGRVVLSASVSRYDTSYFTSQAIRFDSTIKAKISKSVELILVEEPFISPNTISVFNHPSNKVSLEVKKGSGYFHVDEGQFEAAQIQYLQRKRKVEVIPAMDGVMVVTAYDLCLDLTDHPKATVYVSGVGSIELTVRDKIEISSEVKAHVQVLDSKGAPLSASFFPLMNLRAVPGSDFITVRGDSEKGKDTFCVSDIVYGAKVGVHQPELPGTAQVWSDRLQVGYTSLSYQVQLKSGQIVSSEDRQIEVGYTSLSYQVQLKSGQIVSSEDRQIEVGYTSLSYQVQLKSGQIISSEDRQIEWGNTSLSYQVQLKSGLLISSEDRQIEVGYTSLSYQVQLKSGQIVSSEDRQIEVGYTSLSYQVQLKSGQIVSSEDRQIEVRTHSLCPDIVYGAKLRYTSLSYQVQLKSGQIVSSEDRQIEVFPLYDLALGTSPLIIGAEFQGVNGTSGLTLVSPPLKLTTVLQVINVYASGGPSPSSSIEFYMTDEDTAQVSAGGLLTALELGVTQVIGKAVGHDPATGELIVYSQDQVDVHVVMLSGIKIHAPLTRIQKNSEMPLYAVGVTEHETPFTFGSVSPPLIFTWTVTNKDVALLRSTFHQSGISLRDENNFATQLVAAASGHVTVKLKVKAGVPGQVLGHQELRDEVQIKVFDRLTIVNPDLCDGQLLITPDTEMRLKTNRDGAARLTYKISHQDPPNLNLKVDSSGHLMSSTVTGQATVLVTALEEFGLNQTSTLLIKVQRVAYVMLNADTVFRTSNGRLGNIPVGATMSFTVTYHDHVGAVFQATNNRINFRSNRFDHLQVTSGMGNNTLSARATDVGDTIVKVWSQQDPRMVDYINVPVNYAISPPEASLTLGDVTCFTSPLLSEWGHEGSWSVTGKSLTVDGKTGIAVATRIGTSTVKYSVSDGVATHTEAGVSSINRVIVNSPYSFLTNYYGSVKKYLVMVGLGKEINLKGDGCMEKVSELGLPPVAAPYHCLLEISTLLPDLTIADLFHAKAMFDTKSGQYVCEVERVLNDYLAQQISRVDTDIILKVRVSGQSQQPEVTSPELRFAFFPAFYVHNTEVHVSNLSPTSTIRVSVADKLMDQMRILSSDRDILELLPAERDSKAGSLLQFPIRLLDAVWEREKTDVMVELICQSTGQMEKVVVRIKLLGQQPEYVRTKEVGWGTVFHVIAGNYQSSLVLLLAVVATVAVVILAYFAIFGPRYSVSSAPGTFSQPSSPRAPGSPYLGYGDSPGHISPYKADSMNYSPPGGPFSPGTPYRLWSTGYRPQEASPARHRKSPGSPIGGL
ncbi:nuclear pore membrane glycoprotein 210-like [Liolophura sinensis]|uniref:nuclear pore membrane glycoprotein 210-like n=1 Tax=Liolophura sinensis TaxID=3198878 RepID=UPI003157F3E7